MWKIELFEKPLFLFCETIILNIVAFQKTKVAFQKFHIAKKYIKILRKSEDTRCDHFKK